MEKQGPELRQPVRIGHPSPERCAYPSDNEEQAAALSMLPASEGSITDNSSNNGTPPPNQGAPRVAKLAKRRNLSSPSAPYNIHKERERHEAGESVSTVGGKQGTASQDFATANQTFATASQGLKEGFSCFRTVYEDPSLKDNENYYFVVIQGNNPGVYKGRSAADHACGGAHGV
ncbi:hypothetical protein H0H92_004468 [Tricholoma furcatifolium]|nr:hypothetical protein H0H92_004468 [Tricholoma furcatifolium]